MPPAAPATLSAVAVAIAAFAVTGAARAEDLGGVLYERTLMREAGARCKLFEPRVQAALAAGARQAHAAAAARSAPGDLAAREAAARARAAREPCGSPDLRIAAQRVRAAFLGWSRQPSLDLPGEQGGWTAQRRGDRPGPFWALARRLRVGGRPLVVGLRRARAGAPAALTVETAVEAAGAASWVRLAMRDPAQAPAPFLAPDGRPPESALRTFAAASRTGLDGGRAWRFRFGPEAEATFAALDPAEHVRLDFMDGGRVEGRRSVLIAVGDFATGRAFLAAGEAPGG